MKKKFKLVNLSCANCANKMEEEINKIEGVNKANINFIMQKLSIEAEESMFENILIKANDICKKIERDCYIQL